MENFSTHRIPCYNSNTQWMPTPTSARTTQEESSESEYDNLWFTTDERRPEDSPIAADPRQESSISLADLLGFPPTCPKPRQRRNLDFRKFPVQCSSRSSAQYLSKNDVTPDPVRKIIPPNSSETSHFFPKPSFTQCSVRPSIVRAPKPQDRTFYSHHSAAHISAMNLPACPPRSSSPLYDNMSSSICTSVCSDEKQDSGTSSNHVWPNVESHGSRSPRSSIGVQTPNTESFYPSDRMHRRYCVGQHLNSSPVPVWYEQGSQLSAYDNDIPTRSHHNYRYHNGPFDPESGAMGLWRNFPDLGIDEATTTSNKVRGNASSDDDEVECALSKHWTFEQQNGRWPRVGDGHHHQQQQPPQPTAVPVDKPVVVVVTSAPSNRYRCPATARTAADTATTTECKPPCAAQSPAGNQRSINCPPLVKDYHSPVCADYPRYLHIDGRITPNSISPALSTRSGDSDFQQTALSSTPTTSAGNKLIRSTSARLRSAVSQFRHGNFSVRSFRKRNNAMDRQEHAKCDHSTLSRQPHSSDDGSSSVGTKQHTPLTRAHDEIVDSQLGDDHQEIDHADTQVLRCQDTALTKIPAEATTVIPSDSLTYSQNVCDQSAYNLEGHSTKSEALTNDSVFVVESGSDNHHIESFTNKRHSERPSMINETDPSPDAGSVFSFDPTPLAPEIEPSWEKCCAHDNAVDELDPVVERLMLDINSIEEIRSIIRPPRYMGGPFYGTSAPTSPLARKQGYGCPDLLQQLSEIEAYALDKKISDLIQLEKQRRTVTADNPADKVDTESEQVAECGADDLNVVENGVEQKMILTTEDKENSDTNSVVKTDHNCDETTHNNLRRGPGSSPRKRNHPFRWSSLARSHRPTVQTRELEICSLTVNQITSLRKWALLRLATVLEKHSPVHRAAFNWRLPKLLQQRSRSQTEVQQDAIFGQSLSHWQRYLGRPLPPAIYNMMHYLSQVGPTSHGIFRRAGGKMRILALREEIEKNPEWDQFSNWQTYDVADLLKQFFRELPECILTNKVSTTLINIFSCVISPNQLEALQWAVIALPDENRTVLQSLLYLLHHLADHAQVTEMNASNLSVCFAPSLFYFAHAITPAGMSPRRLRRATGGPDPKDLADQKSAQMCLTALINYVPVLFRVSEETLNRAYATGDTQDIKELSHVLRGRDWQSWLQTGLVELIKECSSRAKGWSSPAKDTQKLLAAWAPDVEVHFKKVPATSSSPDSVLPLPLWRGSIEITAQPEQIMEKIWDNRSSWDPEISSTETLEQISDCVDVYRMTQERLTTYYPPLDYCLLRGRQSNLDQGTGHAILMQSVSHELFPPRSAHSRPNVYMDHFYLEQLHSVGAISSSSPSQTSGTVTATRVYCISRVDIRGHSLEWYCSQWAHVICRRLRNLKMSFTNNDAAATADQA